MGVFSFDEVIHNYEQMDENCFFTFFNVFTKFPWIIEFEHRFKFFKHAQKLGDLNLNNETGVLYAKIRRENMIHDGLQMFSYLVKNNQNLRAKFKIIFIDSIGMEEPGIDDGGLFKEFLLQF